MYVISRRAVWVALLGALVASLLTAALASANPDKPYSVVLTDGVAANGSTVTATFVNENPTQRLGSADLTAPSGYTLSSVTASRGSVTVAGNVVELRNLALMPGQSLTVTIVMTSATCSTSRWSVVAKQSNDFSGLPGNDLTLNASNSNLNTAACAAPCKKNSACNTDGSNSNGDANVAAIKSNNTGQLLESVNASKLAPLTCKNPDGSDYVSADRNTYGVFATVDRQKVVTITISNPARSIPRSQQQVCFDAPYQFATATGAPLLPDGDGGFSGLLQTCTKTSVGPCHDRALDSVTGSTVVLVVDIPSGLPGDPHMN
jgi:hypothetical protein